jgi:hypothetical protein
MSFGHNPANLADAGERAGRGRGRFAGVFSAVAAAHILVFAMHAPPGRPPALPPAEPPVVALDMAQTLDASPRGAQAAEPAPAAPPSETPPTPKSAPPAAAPPPKAIPLSPDINALVVPPLDLTAKPVPLPAAPQPTAQPASAAAQSASSSGAGCDLTPAVQVALVGDPTVMSALQAIPRDSLSVAGAVQFWNGAWVDGRELGGDAVVSPIRAAIVAVVARSPADCSDQLVAGPRLITIANPRGAIVVALGSDIWRWSDLLASDAPALPA